MASTSCGSSEDADGQQGGSAGSASGQAGSEGGDQAGPSGDFRKKDLIITARCMPAVDGAGSVRVDGFDPRTWKHQAHVSFPLPDAVFTRNPEHEGGVPETPLRVLCEAVEAADGGPFDRIESMDISGIRSLFDQDFTKMAVVTYDEQTGASHVGYVDRSGELTDLTDEEEFGVTPAEENAVLTPDGQTLWYTSYNDESNEFRVLSRDVAGGDEPVEHWKNDWSEGGPIILGTSGQVALSSSGASISPDGRHILIESQIVTNPAKPGLVDPDVLESAPSTPCADSYPVGWVDNRTLFCDAKDFAVVDLEAPSPATASELPPILPENDKGNEPLLLAPDGEQLIFLARRGESAAHYVTATEPGSAPKELPSTGPLADLDYATAFIEWR